MKRIFYIDFLRISSMLSVILLHACASKLRLEINLSWHLINLLTSFATCSVPIFFMISGSLLLNSDSTANLEKLWHKRIPKLLFPFLIWSVINIIGYAIILNTFNFKSIVASILQIPGKPGEISLWFMYPFIILYVFSPAFLLIAKDSKLLKYVLGIWLIFSITLPSLSTIIPHPFNIIFIQSQDWKIIGGFAGYFLLGYYLSKINIDKYSYKLLTSIFIITILIITIGTYCLYVKTGSYNENFKLYTSIYVVILSSVFFLLCRKLQNNYPQKLIIIFEKVVPASYGVYLIHNLLILFLVRKIALFNDRNNIMIVFLLFLTVTVLSILIINLLSMLPKIGKYITGISKIQ